MSRVIARLPHDCGTRHGLVVFDDDGKVSGYCFSCNKYIPNPLSEEEVKNLPKLKKKSEEEIQREIQEIITYKTFDIPSRGLKKEYLEAFDVKVAVSETDGTTPVAAYFPYYREDKLVGYKARLLHDKKIWGVGTLSDVDLFGWKQAISHSNKKLFITEGEFDAIALYQILIEAHKGTQYASFIPSVVSIPNGAGSASKSLLKALQDIRKFFKEIVLVFDQDEAGRRAVKDVLKVIPDALVANLPAKDANDCLLQGRIKAAKAAVLFNATQEKNTRIVSGASLREAARAKPEFGLPYPWEWLTKKTRGIRTGETIYLGAGQKQGKSEVVNTLAAWCIAKFGWNVFLCKPEESNPKTYKMVAGKFEGKFFHDPTREFDEEAFNRAADLLDKHLFCLDLYQHVGWDTLKQDIRDAVVNNKCKAVFIDPITNLTNGMDAASANTKLQEIAQELSSMAKDLDIVIFIFCHLRNPDSGLPHERGGKVLSSQFAGSRAMARSCNYMFGLEGNRDPSLPEEERNMRTLVLLEDREYGETGELLLYWDNNTGLFNEIGENK